MPPLRLPPLTSAQLTVSGVSLHRSDFELQLDILAINIWLTCGPIGAACGQIAVFLYAQDVDGVPAAKGPA
jgi:hypothetical protein